MNTNSSVFSKLWGLITHPTAEQRETMGEGRPFYIVMSLLLTAVSLLIIANDPTLHDPSILSLFVGLMALHIGIHWLSPHIAADKHGTIEYLITQAVLAFVLVWISDSPALSLALFSAMIGETIGTHGLTRLVFGSVTSYLFLMIGGYFLIGGLDTFMDWLSATFSTTLLLIIFMVLYRRQLDTNEQATALLADLEIAHNQLTDYAVQVEDLTLAAERQRMARELHDTLAQGVAGLVLQLEAADAHLENGRSARAQAIVQQSMKRARSTLADARAAIGDLRLNDRTLFETIQYLTDHFTQATGIPCHLKLELRIVPQIIADHAERIISESLTNITRHAQANNVQLDVVQLDDLLVIEVRDDGVGFDVETAVAAGHYGLLGIRERVRLINGTFEISSKVKEGTYLRISLPLEAA
ncbi:MAG: sensor histidine kinase [Chloroflexi bacterium]|nr:sensor histidine kinase [Chloroflexota bacterium]